MRVLYICSISMQRYIILLLINTLCFADAIIITFENQSSASPLAVVTPLASAAGAHLQAARKQKASSARYLQPPCSQP